MTGPLSYDQKSGLELRFSLSLKEQVETHLCFLPIFFNSNSQPIWAFRFHFSGSAAAPEEGMSQPRDRWEMLAPRSGSVTALLPPDCFPPFSWAQHCCPLHICASSKLAASRWCGSCLSSSIWEPFTASLKHEKKKNQVPL